MLIYLLAYCIPAGLIARDELLRMTSQNLQIYWGEEEEEV